jgi:hypothetical protein
MGEMDALHPRRTIAIFAIALALLASLTLSSLAIAFALISLSFVISAVVRSSIFVTARCEIIQQRLAFPSSSPRPPPIR